MAAVLAGLNTVNRAPSKRASAFIGTNPQVAVASGGDREHGVLRQPVLFAPLELLVPAEDAVQAHHLRVRGGHQGEHQDHYERDRASHHLGNRMYCLAIQLVTTV